MSCCLIPSLDQSGSLYLSGYMREAHPQVSSGIQKGFTIVELVIVILMISILSAVVFARFQDQNTFNASIVRDQIISLSRIAQQSSLGRADVSLAITPTASNSVLLEVESGGVFQSFELDLDGVTLTGDVNKLDGGSQTPSCEADDGDTAITAGAPMIINFGELSDLEEVSVGGVPTAVTSAVRICLDNRAVDSVCISPAGYAYAGNCDVDP